ncbi:MAG: diguanylate cyclase [Desulfobacteraceae bacterium]|nr:diguanylate cyclase [Desulfobacteraceae bacterium]
MSIRTIYSVFLLFFMLLSPVWANEKNRFQIDFSNSEKEWIKNHPVIRVANEMDWPPFDFNEFDEPEGLVIDYIKLLAGKAGLEIDFVYGYTWAELIELFKQKKIDVLPVFYKNDERKGFTLYTSSYHRAKLAIFINIDNKTQHAGLLNKRVGIEKSHGSIPIVRQQISGTIVEIDTIADLVRKLATKNLDAIIGNPFVVYFHAKENQINNIQLSGYLSLSEQEQQDTSFHVGIRKDWPILHNILQKTMQNVGDSEMKEIKDKWVDISIVKQLDWVLVAQVSGVIVLILIFLIWNNRILKSMVKAKTYELKKLNKDLESIVALRTKELSKLNKELEKIANVDKLTGLWNRRAIEPFIDKEMSRSKRANSFVSLMILDFDHFKQVNDQYGHVFGDEVLKRVGQKIKTMIRSTDNLARWGGEEFLILVTDTCARKAILLAEKIRKAVMALRFEGKKPITVSIGVAEYHPDESFEQWYERTDAALYQAKKKGRNRVELDPRDGIQKGQTAIAGRNILRLIWKNEYYSGNDKIDGQHIQLFNLSNQFIDAFLSNTEEKIIETLLEKLSDLLKDHFKSEEEIMAQSGYPGLENHMGEHDKIRTDLTKLIAQYHQGYRNYGMLIQFISIHFVFEHMLNEDKNYFQWVDETTLPS